ncbi:MAG: cobalamin-dependent protein [Bacillota bacterium]
MVQLQQEVSQMILNKKEQLVRRFLQLREQPFADESLPGVNEYINYLAETSRVNSKELFADYINWAAELIKNRSYSIVEIKKDLKTLTKVLKEELSIEQVNILEDYINQALQELSAGPKSTGSFLKEDNPYFDLATDYLNLLLDANREAAYQLINDAVENGAAVKDIYLHVFEKVQKEIGRLWQVNEINVATEHYCTSLTQLIMARLYPHILNFKEGDYTAVTTCVGNELHELGIRMIADLLEVEGWDTYHLGANTPNSDIIDTVIDKEADLVCISVTMGAHMEETLKLIEGLKNNEKLEAKIMVGGYPFNVKPKLWKEIGADGYASNAQQAVQIAQDLLSE